MFRRYQQRATRNYVDPRAFPIVMPQFEKRRPYCQVSAGIPNLGWISEPVDHRAQNGIWCGGHGLEPAFHESGREACVIVQEEQVGCSSRDGFPGGGIAVPSE